MRNPLAGMYAALMTAFNDEGEYDVDRQKALNAYVLRQGLQGLYVGGSSGESGLLSTEELLEQQINVAESAQGTDATLIAHVGAPSLRDSIRLAKKAQRLGYHGLSALPPHAYPFSDGELIAYYRDLAAATDLPLIVYEVPVRTGRPIPLETLETILDLPNVAGIKFTSTDLFKFSLLRKHRPSHLYFFGFDEIYLAGAALGADGGIGTTYNILGQLYGALDKAVRLGDLPRAQNLQRVSQTFVETLAEVGVLPGMKSALRVAGIECGSTRLPMASRDSAIDQRIAALMEQPDIAQWILPAP